MPTPPNPPSKSTKPNGTPIMPLAAVPLAVGGFSGMPAATTGSGSLGAGSFIEGEVISSTVVQPAAPLMLGAGETTALTTGLETTALATTEATTTALAVDTGVMTIGGEVMVAEAAGGPVGWALLAVTALGIGGYMAYKHYHPDADPNATVDVSQLGPKPIKALDPVLKALEQEKWVGIGNNKSERVYQPSNDPTVRYREINFKADQGDVHDNDIVFKERTTDGGKTWKVGTQDGIVQYSVRNDGHLYGNADPSMPAAHISPELDPISQKLMAEKWQGDGHGGAVRIISDPQNPNVAWIETNSTNRVEDNLVFKVVKDADNKGHITHEYTVTNDGHLQSMALGVDGKWVPQGTEGSNPNPDDLAVPKGPAHKPPVVSHLNAQAVTALEGAGITLDGKQHLDSAANEKLRNLIAKIEGTEEYQRYAQDHHYNRPNDLIFGKGVDEVGAQMVKDGRLTQDEAKIFNALHDMGHGDGNSVGRQLAANGYHVPDAQTAEQMVAAANTQRLAAPPKSTVVAGSTTPTVVDPNANPAASSTLVPTAANGRNYRNLPNALLNNLAYQEASGANLPGVTPIQTRNALGDLVTTVTHVEGGHQVTDLYTQGPVENFSQTYVDGHRQSLVIMDKTGAVTRDFEMNEKGQLAAVKPQTPNGTVPTSTTSLASKQFPAQSTTARVVDELRAIEGTGTSGHQNNVGGYDYSGTANMVLDGRTVTLTTHTEADPSKNTWGFVERGADGREIRVSGTGNPSIDAVAQQVDQVQNAGAASSTRSVASAQPVSQSGTAQVGNPFTNVHIQSVPNGHGGLDLRGTLDLANGGGTLRVASHTERNTHGGTDLEGTVAMPDGSTLQLSAVGDSKPDKGKWLIVGHHPGTPDVKVSGTGALPPLGDIVQIDKQAQISKLAQPRV